MLLEITNASELPSLSSITVTSSSDEQAAKRVVAKIADANKILEFIK